MGRSRVLSAYVKELKFEYTYGKLRETKLLEELISGIFIYNCIHNLIYLRVEMCKTYVINLCNVISNS